MKALFAALSLVLLVGCADLPKNAYKATGTVVVTVDTAMTVWGDYVHVQHPPVEQELQVKAAFQKYQAAALVAIDAATAYSLATDSAGQADATLRLNAALAQSAQTLSELLELLRTFGVKI